MVALWVDAGIVCGGGYSWFTFLDCLDVDVPAFSLELLLEELAGAVESWCVNGEVSQSCVRQEDD